jgi:hypothetical protein
MGRYYLMMIIAALILTAFAAIGMAMNVSKHPSLGTAASASYRSSMARSAGRSWWLTHRHPRAASKRPFYARGPIKPD